MRKLLEMNGQTIPYDFKPNRRSRSIRLTVRGDGTLLVSAPHRIAEQRVTDFIKKKSAWITATLDRINAAKTTAPFTGTAHEYQSHRIRALRLAKERLQHFNAMYLLPYGRVSIRNPKTRWGSCSKKGDLSFSYKIALLDPELVDYIIVHELAHVGEFNHSPRFWALVAKTIPNYKRARKSLRTLTALR